ncbi:Nose resistant to fluoxetine protein 6 [Nymphon striatum]|nr:Nose resistant to fluoxetine protein 6 [Nymphon striatum]
MFITSTHLLTVLLLTGGIGCSLSEESAVFGEDLEESAAFDEDLEDSNATTLLPPEPETTTPIITDKCTQDVNAMMYGLTNSNVEYLWAKKILDAWAKPPAGVLEGTMIWPGSYSECKELDVSYKIGNVSGNFKGQFDIAIIKYTKYEVHYGYCLPDSCDPSVFKTVFYKIQAYLPIPALGKLILYELIKNAKTSEVTDKLDWHWRGIVGLVIVSIFGCVIVLATLYDIYKRNVKKEMSKLYANEELGNTNGAFEKTETENSDSSSQLHLNAVTYSSKTEKTASNTCYRSDQSLDQSDRSSLIISNLWKRYHNTDYICDRPTSGRPQVIEGVPGWLAAKILLCFSAYTNGEKLLNTGTNEKSIGCIHGIRFISMSWVILGHTYYFGLALTANPLSLVKLEDSFTFQAIITGGPFSVDTFFLLSGALVAYLFFNHHAVVGSIKNIGWIKFYVHRIWRLTPAYMLILGIYICLFPYLASGPFWRSDGMEVDYCKDTWWTNLLYINNFVHSSKMCMGWTWYLANDMQFYVISPLILIPLALYKFAGLAVILVFLVVSWAVSAYVLNVDHIINSNTGGIDIAGSFMPDFYIKPYTRIGPYLVGLLLGYILHKTKFDLSIKKRYVSLGWILAAALNLSVVYGLYHTHPNGDTIKTYYVLSRTAWAIGVSWVIFACVHGYGGFVNTFLSWKALIPLSRLTYCAYLIHPVVMYFFYYTRHTLIQPIEYVYVPYFLCHMCIAYGIAFILSISFESPMMNLEKVFLQRKMD